jgi:hypothetical protein
VHLQGGNDQRTKNTSAIASDCSTLLDNSFVFTLKMEAIHYSKTTVPKRTTRLHIPKDDILKIPRREDMKSYIALTGRAL